MKNVLMRYDDGRLEKGLIETDCCFEHEGKKFCSSGSIISANRMQAYTHKGEKGLEITTWHGELISDRAFYGDKHPWGYKYVHFIYDGSWWLGRELANAELITAKRTKEKVKAE